MKKVRSNKGFTLVELIIVIAILAIIMLIAIPNFSGIQQRMQVRADKSTAAQIGKAVRIWYTEYNSDPSFKALVTKTAGIGTGAEGANGDPDPIEEENLPKNMEGEALSGAEYKSTLPHGKDSTGVAMAHLCELPELVSYVDTTLVPTSLIDPSTKVKETDQYYFVGLIGSGTAEKVVVAIDTAAPTLTNVIKSQADVLYNGEVSSDLTNKIAYMEP